MGTDVLSGGEKTKGVFWEISDYFACDRHSHSFEYCMNHWALIDYENITDFTNIDLASYERVFVFCGPRHKHLKIDSLPVSAFWNLEILRIPTTGKNNLDFHLAFHLGILHEKAPPNIGFHIVSGDQGFDGLVHHLKALKRTCKRLGPPVNPVLGDLALRIVGLLDKAGRSRPRKEASLLKWIASHVPKEQADKAKSLLAELKRNQQVSICAGAVTYTLTAAESGKTIKKTNPPDKGAMPKLKSDVKLAETDELPF